MTNKIIPIHHKIGYGMGNMTYGIVSQVMATYIVFYTTSVLGISGGLVGSIVSISVLWDAFTDPVMGYISDHTYSRIFGRRHLYILVGGLSLAYSNYLLWNIKPEWSMSAKIILVMILLIVSKTCLTIYTTPYSALGAEISKDYNERTSIQGIRTIFFLMGIVGATVLGMAVFFVPTMDYPVGQLNPESYSNMGLTTSLIAILFTLICFLSTRQYVMNPGQEKQKEKKRLLGIFKELTTAFKNHQYRYVVLAYLSANIGTGILSTLGLHVYTYTLGYSNSQIATVVGILFGVSVLSQPLWVMISKKIDKKPSVILGLLISIGATLIFLVLVIFRQHVMGQILYSIPFAVMAGFGMGALFSIPLSMVADTVDLEELNSGMRPEGIYYGMLTLSYKLSQAIAIFLLGLLLEFIRFDANASIQPEATTLALGITVAAGIILGSLGAIIAYLKYNLNADKVRGVQKQIENQREIYKVMPEELL